MTSTFCDSPAAAPRAWPLPPRRLPAPSSESRAYFRCDPLLATISVQQCRANRERITPHEALALPFELPPWWVRPLACCSCALAPRVEAGRVPFYSAEQVLSGAARAAPADTGGSHTPHN